MNQSKINLKKKMLWGPFKKYIGGVLMTDSSGKRVGVLPSILLSCILMTDFDFLPALVI